MARKFLNLGVAENGLELIFEWLEDWRPARSQDCTWAFSPPFCQRGDVETSRDRGTASWPNTALMATGSAAASTLRLTPLSARRRD